MKIANGAPYMQNAGHPNPEGLDHPFNKTTIFKLINNTDVCY
jgi:hypothetical protein